MPELPEVEYARKRLTRWLTGATITSAIVHDSRILYSGTSTSVARALLGRRVQKIERRGKWLRLVLDEGVAFSHLGMTGKWVSGDDDVRFERLHLDVKKGNVKRRVRYLDPRLFGTFFVGVKDLPVWSTLGPDPILDGIDVTRLHGALSRRTLAIKPALLDQKLLAGVGNIQATEALWLAKLDPRRPARTLTLTEVAALARGIDKTLRDTIAHTTGPQIVYVEEPGAPNPFRIYGRAAEPCPRCRTKLVKIGQTGRSTVYCPHCQATRRRT